MLLSRGSLWNVWLFVECSVCIIIMIFVKFDADYPIRCGMTSSYGIIFMVAEQKKMQYGKAVTMF